MTDSQSLFSSGNFNLNSSLKDKSKSISTETLLSTPADPIFITPLLLSVQKKVIDEIDASVVEGLDDETDLKRHLEPVVDSIINRDFPTLNKKDKAFIIQALIDEFTSLGPLKNLIFDDSVSEIMVNGPQQVFVEKEGCLVLTDVKFRNAEHVMQQIEKIIAPLGRRLDESSPMVDARLPNGSRINAVIPPVSLIGPVLTIRKFSAIPLTMDGLVSKGTLNKEMAIFLEKAVLAKSNILVAGGTGSGKTTFLNVLSAFIPNEERIITIEDAAEIQLRQAHVISLESRPSNIEGKGEITIRDLLRNSLRMRPNRIIVGEVRGAETLDMLQAMNTGHNGSLSTVHANSPRDTLSRLETMVLLTGIDFPIRVIREQIGSAIDIIVYLERLPDGSRKVICISELLGLEGEIISLQDLFYFTKMGTENGKMLGEFSASPVRPRIYDKFKSLGISNER